MEIYLWYYIIWTNFKFNKSIIICSLNNMHALSSTLTQKHVHTKLDNYELLYICIGPLLRTQSHFVTVSIGRWLVHYKVAQWRYKIIIYSGNGNVWEWWRRCNGRCRNTSKCQNWWSHRSIHSRLGREAGSKLESPEPSWVVPHGYGRVISNFTFNCMLCTHQPHMVNTIYLVSNITTLTRITT